MQQVGGLVRGVASALRENGGGMRNQVGLAITSVRRGVAPATPDGMVMALCCARRAARRGHDPVGLFWFLVKRPERVYAIDSEWAGVRVDLEAAGRTVDDLLRIARTGEMRGGIPQAHHRDGRHDRAMRAAHDDRQCAR